MEVPVVWNVFEEFEKLAKCIDFETEIGIGHGSKTDFKPSIKSDV